MTTTLKTIACIILGLLSAIGFLSVAIGFMAFVFNCAYKKHKVRLDNEDKLEISLITGI